MCGSVVEGVINQMVQCIPPRCDLPHIRLITLSRFLDACRVKCPDAGIPKARMCHMVPNLVLNVSRD